jgi:hypothetical protein
MKISDFLKLDLKTLLIIGLIVALVFTKMCGGSSDKPGETVSVNGKDYEVLSHEIDTQFIPKPVVKWKKGSDIYHDTTIYVPVPVSADTAAILKDYFAKRVYIDTLQLKDSMGYIVVNDTVSKNSLLGRLWNAQVNKTQISERLIVKELPKNQVYIGLVGGFDKTSIVNYAGTSLLLKTKSDKIYSIGLGYRENAVMSVQGSLYWKIKLKK